VLVPPVRKRHDLRRSRLEPAVVAQGIGMEEVSLDDVGQRLNVPVRVHGPGGAWDDAVVVEHAQRPDADLRRVVLAVE
jgi:hypothetical protein